MLDYQLCSYQYHVYCTCPSSTLLSFQPGIELDIFRLVSLHANHYIFLVKCEFIYTLQKRMCQCHTGGGRLRFRRSRATCSPPVPISHELTQVQTYYSVRYLILLILLLIIRGITNSFLTLEVLKVTFKVVYVDGF